MKVLIASLALLVAVSSATSSNILDFNPEERPEVAIQAICAAYPQLKSCQQVNQMEKRKSAYMRFGRSSPFDGDDEMPGGEMEKRKSAYMRFGKRAASEDSEIEMNKRKSAYMRFGKRSAPETEAEVEMEVAPEKRKSAYMRFGKRAMESVMNGEMPEITEVDQPMMKRKSAYMRFGKRSSDAAAPESVIDGQEVAKRKSAYMRFGR